MFKLGRKNDDYLSILTSGTAIREPMPASADTIGVNYRDLDYAITNYLRYPPMSEMDEHGRETSVLTFCGNDILTSNFLYIDAVRQVADSNEYDVGTTLTCTFNRQREVYDFFATSTSITATLRKYDNEDRLTVDRTMVLVPRSINILDGFVLGVEFMIEDCIDN